MRNAMWVGGGITGMGEIPVLGVKEKGIAKVIRDIFRNGEQGFFYDPSDMGTMYQDLSATTAVSATGQPVGILLDKSKGLNFLPYIVDQKNFTDLSGWTVGTSVSAKVVAGEVELTCSGSIVNSAANWFRPTADQVMDYSVWEVSFDATHVSGGYLQVGAGYVTGVLIHPGSNGGIKKHYTTLVAQHPVTPRSTCVFGGESGAVWRLSNIKCRQLSGNHAGQNTSAARPILKQTPILGVSVMPNFDITEGGTVGVVSDTTKNSFNVVEGTGGIRYSNVFEEGKTYRLKARVATTASHFVFANISNGAVPLIANAIRGTVDAIFTATSSFLYLRSGTGITTLFELEIREVKGYHTNQNYIEYDGVDDKLITGLPAPLTNATVLRAIPGVGAVVKYSQTLPMLYEDSTDHAGLIAIDRALTRQEQLRLMTELDKKAGATSLDTLAFRAFDNNQVGFVYDPNDLSTMFQDAAGTIPVTAVGQPVGLILDKSKGLTRKPVTLVNSSFDSGISGWAVGPSLSATWSNGEARIVGTGDIASVNNTLRSSESGSANKLYKVSFDATWVSGGYLQAGSPYREGLRVLPIDNGGIKKRYSYQIAQHPISPNNICCFAAESGAVWLIDNVSIEEIVGNHAYQTTSASRPILRKNSETGAYYLEFDGSDDFLQTNNIDFTATDKVSLFTGVTKLSDSGQIIAELSSNTAANAGSFYLVAGNDLEGVGYSAMGRGTLGASASRAARSFTYPAPDVAVLSVKHDISGDLSSMRRNSVVGVDGLGDKGEGNFGNYPLFIGRRGGTASPFTGHIYGIMGIGKLASVNEITVIEKELAKRTGVDLNV